MSDFKDKFRFKETFTNFNGKSSGSGFIGVYLGLIAGIGILAGIFGYFFQIPETMAFFGEILKLVVASTILLGVRKVGGQVIASKNGKSKENVK